MATIRELMEKATVVAKIMAGREKGDTESLIKLDDPVTIDNFEMYEQQNDKGETEPVYVYTIKEDTEHFFFAGAVLKNFFDLVVKDCLGDYEDAYEKLAKEPVKVKFSAGKTKNNQKVTLVRLVG